MLLHTSRQSVTFGVPLTDGLLGGLVLPREVIEEIRARVDIADVVQQTVTLQRRGSSLVGLCPFHQEKSPSFNVVQSKGIYHCFGCGEGGDVFAFLQKTRGMSFFEAVKELGDSVGVQVEERELTREERQRMRARASLHDVLDLATSWFHGALTARPDGRSALAYLKGRGITDDTIERWRLGWAPDSWDALLSYLHGEGVSADLAIRAGLAKPSRTGRGSAYDLFRGRVIVPIRDKRGRVVAFGGRILPGTSGAERDAPKYVNSPETPIYKKSSVLFGLSSARNAVQRKGRALIVEGYFDVISLHQHGFSEAIATCGTALTREHLKILRPLTRAVVALFDADEAGLRAAERSLPLFVESGIEARRLEIGAKDPDELVQSDGPEALEAALKRSEPLLALVVRRAVKVHGSTPGGRREVLTQVAPILQKMDGAARRGAIQLVARSLAMMETEVDELLARGPRTPRVGPVAPPARWTGSIPFNHIAWLLLHFPDQVRPVLSGPDVDPTLLTERATALEAVSMLMAGDSLASVLEQIDDPDLARVLRVAAARPGLYTEDAAASAARQILVRLRVGRLRAERAEVDRLLSECDPGTEWSRFSQLLERKSRLNATIDALQAEARRGGADQSAP